MKKLLLITAVLLIAGGTAFSQVQFGVGAIAGTKLKYNDNGDASINFGAHARGLFEISDEIFATAGLSYFLPYKVSSSYGSYTIEQTLNFATLNADINYYFMDNGDFMLYGLGGVNYGLAMVKMKETGEPDISDTEGHFDFEVGVGARTEKLFGELRYDNSNENFLLTVGIYIN